MRGIVGEAPVNCVINSLKPCQLGGLLYVESRPILARLLQIVEELADFFGVPGFEPRAAFEHRFCKCLFAMHIAFLELIQETWIIEESTKTENAFETASGNRARILGHAVFREQDRGLKARQATYKQKHAT